ncbi:hypothetical protein ZOSMA_143G00170 [Zostera marina]|uniref:Uncharacterized protein n=1 Tax=Zostera marina TaxID=29655 RepID=A0A0K9PZT4_ZOSMR|nr:hypothetical protein ZOSMA_143G00170 [Zostera marina]
MFHTNAAEEKGKDDMDGANDKVKINFTPSSFNLQLFVAEKGKSEAEKFMSETVKVNSKAVNVTSEAPMVNYEAGHVTYEANKESIKIPFYVVKGKGSTDYPTMKKVKEELYETWEVKIKDNANKLGSPSPNNCNPEDNEPKEPTVTRPYEKDIPDYVKFPSYLSSQEDPEFLNEVCVLADKAEKAKLFLEKMRDLNKGDNILKMTREWNAREREGKENERTLIKQVVTTIIDSDDELDNVPISSRQHGQPVRPKPSSMVKRIKDQHVNQVKRKHDLILKDQVDQNKLTQRKLAKDEHVELNKLIERAALDRMLTIDNVSCDSASLISITTHMPVKGPVLNKKIICDHMRTGIIKFLHPIQMVSVLIH